MDDLRFRPPTPTDAPGIHALIRRAEVADSIPIVASLAEVEENFDEPHFDPAVDAVVVDDDGTIVAWGRVWHVPSGERQERAYLWGSVDPSHRGQGIGRAVFAWTLERANQRLSEARPDLPRFIRFEDYDWRQDAHHLAERFGLQPVRYNDELLRSLAAVDDPATVAGVDIVPWTPAHDASARLVANAAFADHWGSTPLDEAVWASHLSSHGSRPELSFVAVAGGEVVGYCRNAHYPDDEALHGRREGWIDSLGVLREWRKRGIASSLVQHSLVAFAAAGFTHAMIGVDSENPTGAAALYESLGFVALHRLITREIAL